MDNRPIGVFDSGIGGLTVAAAITRQLPNERIVYFGDTAHLPYGEKSANALRSYAVVITNFLLANNCKAIVIACNSASAVATDTVRHTAGRQVPVIDVVNPTARHAVQLHPSGKIGVIATKATVNSRIYARRIAILSKEAKVTMLATPLLVAMIEEGFFNNNISKAVIADYLDKPNLRDIDALILGCTHFPLIKREIQALYQGRVDVIDATDVVAQVTAAALQKQDLLSGPQRGGHKFYVSDLTPSFTQSTQLFFGKKVKLERKNLWD